MRRVLIAGGIAVVAALSLTALASSQTSAPRVLFAAALNVGQEVPHAKGTKVGAAGRFTATVSGTTLKWTLTFSHLSGAATAAHVHLGKRGKAGAVVIPLCGPCKSSVTGSAPVTIGLLNTMKDGGAYVNVHTARNPNGEIRGQLGLSPKPSTSSST